MKLNVEKNHFLKALSHGQSVVEKRTTVPILSHVMLSATEDGLVLTSTDMDLALIETIPTQVETPGTVCVSAHMLYEIVRKLGDYPIALEHDDDKGRLKISSGSSEFNLSSLPAEDFPQLTHGQLTHHFTLPTEELVNLIDKTRFSMSNEETRYHLNGIHLHALTDSDKPVLRSVATDMHRLACTEAICPQEAIDIPEVIIGKKAIQEIRRLLDDEQVSVVRIGLSSSRVEFELEGEGKKAVLTSRLVDGSFPDYQAALNVDNDKVLIVPTKDFAKAVDRVGTVVTDKVRAIRVNLQDNKATISALSQEFGTAQEVIEVDFPYPDPLEICFNVKYLLDITQQINCDEMKILLLNSDSSALVRPANDHDNSTYLLMPMRI